GEVVVIIDVSITVVKTGEEARKYVENGCELFLAQVTGTVSKEKRVEDVPVVRDFPEVFPEDLPGLPPPRQVEFRIDLIPGDDEEEAFQTLKLKLCCTSILSLPEGSEDFAVYCDASLKGFGAVLMQREKAFVIGVYSTLSAI
nr:putative reverse transcriptase domain-containing protein [Tanacetum cinerariifolium]